MTIEATVPADGVVAYRHFVVPTNFTEDKYVQFLPSRLTRFGRTT